MLYVLRGGIAWRALPHDFPPWQTVYYHFRQLKMAGAPRLPPEVSPSSALGKAAQRKGIDIRRALLHEDAAVYHDELARDVGRVG